jgi:hypothetical protein
MCLPVGVVVGQTQLADYAGRGSDSLLRITIGAAYRIIAMASADSARYC